MAAGRQASVSTVATSSGEALAFGFTATQVFITSTTESTGTAGAGYWNFTTTSGASTTDARIKLGGSVQLRAVTNGQGWTGISWRAAAGVGHTIDVIAIR